MSRKSVLFLSILIFPVYHIYGQNISGTWSGTLWQQTGGMRSDYHFGLDLEIAGKNIFGTTYISYIDKPEIYALFKISGSFENGILKFFEKEIISQREDQSMYWCTKFGALQYSQKNETEFLSGNWDAQETGCSPGTIMIWRKKTPITEVVVKEPEQEKTEIINETNKKPNKNNNTKKQVSPKRENTKGTTIKTTSNTVTLKIFDHGIEDNDTISLYFNDKLILDNYRLTKQQHKIVLELKPKPAKNSLVFYAKNLGSTPPNTATVIVETEGFTKKVLIRSDLKQSDVIYFESSH